VASDERLEDPNDGIRAMEKMDLGIAFVKLARLEFLLQIERPFRHDPIATCCAPLAEGRVTGIHASNVWFRWRNSNKVALRGISLHVRPGSWTMLLGPNGCGKSTLIQVLGNLFLPDMGVVEVEAPMAIVFQDPATQMFMPTVGADVMMRCGDPNLARAALRRVRMEPFWAHSPRRLSGGQKQRVVVASALSTNPKVILFDEATASMDYL